MYRNSKCNIMIILIIAVMIVTAISCVGVNAATVPLATAKVNCPGDVVNLRKSASTSSAIVKSLKDNSSLKVKRIVFKNATSTAKSKKWYEVTAGKKNGYIRADYVDSIKYSNIEAITTTDVNYRAGAGTKMKLKGTLEKGTKVKVYLKAKPVEATKGDSSLWYLIGVGNKKYYACSKYFKLEEDRLPVPVETASDKDKPQQEEKKEETKKEEIKVKAEDVRIELADITHPSGTIDEGNAFSLRGKIKCNFKITNISIGIADQDGKWVYSVSKKPDSKTFDVSSVDPDITFGILAEGSYRYRAVIKAEGFNKTAFDYFFNVRGTVEKTLNDEIVKQRIDEMLQALNGEYFTSDRKPCTSAVGDSCNVENVLKDNNTVRQLLNEKKGGKDLNLALLPQHFNPGGIAQIKGWSCCGFANFAGWYVGADTINDNVNYRAVKIDINYDYENMSMYARVGDILRSTSHSYMLISVEKDGCVVIDSNWDHTCMVSKHTVAWSCYGSVTVNRAVNRADN